MAVTVARQEEPSLTLMPVVAAQGDVAAGDTRGGCGPVRNAHMGCTRHFYPCWVVIIRAGNISFRIIQGVLRVVGVNTRAALGIQQLVRYPTTPTLWLYGFLSDRLGS